MGTGEDLANISASVAKDTVQKTASTLSKITGTFAKTILELILNKLKDQNPEKMKFGQTSLDTILKSGQEIKMIEIGKSDIKDFSKVAKQYGVQFAVISQKNKETKSIIFKAGDVERVQKALEVMIEMKLQSKKSKQQSSEETRENQNQKPEELKKQNEKKVVDLKESKERPSLKKKLENIKEKRESTKTQPAAKAQATARAQPASGKGAK